jgi:cell wall assembly regulator SMI1
LPEDFKAAYGIHNGQQGGGDLIPAIAENEEGYFLMPIKAIISEWKSWKSLVDNGEFKGKESSPDNWHPGRLVAPGLASVRIQRGRRFHLP